MDADVYEFTCDRIAAAMGEVFGTDHMLPTWLEFGDDSQMVIEQLSAESLGMHIVESVDTERTYTP